MLLAATAAQAEDRKCHDSRLCHTKNYVTNPNEYGWSGIGAEVVQQRVKGFGWKQKKAVFCECLEPSSQANEPMKTLMLGFVLLAANIVAAQCRGSPQMLPRNEYEIYEDMAVAKRQCDPKNFVTNPNEYGWVCKADNDATRVKGFGAKQKKDAIAACE